MKKQSKISLKETFISSVLAGGGIGIAYSLGSRGKYSWTTEVLDIMSALIVILISTIIAFIVIYILQKCGINLTWRGGIDNEEEDDK